MIARVVIVFAGYLFFSAMGDNEVAAGVALWAGVVLVGWFVVDLFTREPDSRMGTVGVAAGVALIAAGLVLALTP
jgi:hypothetical protein